MKTIKLAFVCLSLALASIGLCGLSGQIISSSDYNEPFLGWGGVVREDSLHRRMTIDTVTDEVVMEYCAWWYWIGDPIANPEAWYGDVNVEVNGQTVNTVTFGFPDSKTFIPNVNYNFRLPESWLRMGENLVTFTISLPNGAGGADHWHITMRVVRT